VRGYRQNQRVQDQGVVASLEVRVPVWRGPERWGSLHLAPFFDYGRVWNHSDRPDRRKKTLASAGIGLLWSLPRFFDARIYWGQNLNSVDASGNLQDDGVQFLISARFP
jgi:hemolysin activation/secretion protein